MTITQISHSLGFARGDIILFNNKIYFTGLDNAKLEQIYRVDLDGSNLTNISNFTHSDALADIRMEKLLSFNNRLYLQAYSRDKTQQNSVSTQMYVSDGISEFQLFEGIPNTNGASFEDGFYTISNNKLYYFYVVNWGVSTPTYQLWCSDGTQGGASMIKQFVNANVNPFNPLAYHNAIYFTATDPVHGAGLWVVNENGLCSLIRSIGSTSSLFIFNDKLNFYDSGVIMLSDGSSAGTHPWQDSVGNSFKPVSLSIFQNKVYFFDSNYELCSFDGATVTRIKNFPLEPPAFYSPIGECGNKIFFSVKTNGGSSATDLWSSDGTSEGTAFFQNLNLPSANTTGPLFFLSTGDKLYFLAATEQHVGDSDLWLIDSENAYRLSKVLPDTFQGYMDQKSATVNNVQFAFCMYNNSSWQLYRLEL